MDKMKQKMKKKKKNNADSYLSIKKEVRRRLAVGRCRFIATLCPVASEEEARRFIERIKIEFSDATHNTFAYRVGFKRNLLERCSDDREPVGTAGPPILSVLRKAELTDTAMVVTRYFGGVKLGVGGLIRAYRAAAEEGLKAASTVRRVYMERLKARLPYENLGAATKLISSRKGKIISIEYGEDVVIDFHLRSRDKDGFRRALHDATRGRGYLLI